MITIISDDEKQNIGHELLEELCEKGIAAEYVSLTGAEVEPCLNCAGCTYITHGKCVTRDDADWILPKLINSEVMLFVTPITWGSYSFRMKRLFDKCALIGDRYYYVKDKELVKRMQGKIKDLYVLGVKDNCSPKEASVFKSLVAENILIMSLDGGSYVVDNHTNKDLIRKIVEEMKL